MGSKNSVEHIREYACSVFGEEFEENSVITEDRLTPSEFLTIMIQKILRFQQRSNAIGYKLLSIMMS